MAEAFGLERRIEAYSGKRPIGFYRWDLDCLLAVMDLALKDQRAYPDKASSSYAALKRLHDRLQEEYRRLWELKAPEARLSLLSGITRRSTRTQIAGASHKSDGVSVIKIADKTSNLLAIANSPPPWPRDWKRAYVEWARAVVSGLPFKPAGLMTRFEEAARLATESIE